MVLITLLGIASLMLFNPERVNSKVDYVSFHYNFKKGDEFMYKIVTERKFNTLKSSSTLFEGIAPYRETIFMTIKVIDVDDKGIANLEVGVDFGIIQSKKIKVTKSPQIGKKIYCKISPQGTISDFKGEPSSIAGVAGYIFSFVQNIPDKGLKVGDKWTMPGFMNYEILAWETIDGHDCFKISGYTQLEDKEGCLGSGGIYYLAYKPKAMFIRADFTRTTIKKQKPQLSIEEKVTIELL
jgi:hypothetical protein